MSMKLYQKLMSLFKKEKEIDAYVWYIPVSSQCCRIGGVCVTRESAEKHLKDYLNLCKYEYNYSTNYDTDDLIEEVKLSIEE